MPEVIARAVVAVAAQVARLTVERSGFSRTTGLAGSFLPDFQSLANG